MQLREEFPYDVRQIMTDLPCDGELRHKIRDFTLNPRIKHRARSVKAFAEDLGFYVQVCELPSGMNGRLVMDAFSDNGYRIEVSSRLSVEAMRFGVLHEMGHYFRHKKDEDPLDDVMHFDPTGQTFYVDHVIEREANEFAEALLFGAGQLSAAYSLLGGKLDKIAKYFGVTEKVAQIALQKLLRG